MLHEVLNDFLKVNDVSKDLFNRYKEKLPTEVLNLWQECGFGTFYNSYLKVINPDEYINLIQKSYFFGDVSIPIFATAFGDIITWEKNKFVGIVKYRFGSSDVISDGFDFFYDIIADKECASDYFTIDKYNVAVKKYGKLKYDECFGYTPLLALGGKESVNNIKKVKIKEHLALIAEVVGEI